MRLMGASEIMSSVAGRGQLRIDNFSKKCLQHSSYYIRLGSRYFRMGEGMFDEPLDIKASNGILSLEPGEFVRATSHEHFNLGAGVLGILGGVSDAQSLGIALVAGQFIDPLFPGGNQAASLQFGIKNLSESPAALQLERRIAKVCFFDVSDTKGLELIPDSDAATKYAEARENRSMRPI